MSLKKKIEIRKKRRTFRVRNVLKKQAQTPRVTVFRSLKHIYAQIIDDTAQTTVVSFSSAKLTTKGSKKDLAKQVGLELGKLFLDAQKGLEVHFDRGCYKYHGRVAALADGLRESGLKF